MQIVILGSAAGGGLPQWNCACAHCRAAREGAIPSRTQSSIAFRTGGTGWFLLNASPDLRAQMERHPDLQARPAPVRNSSLEAILLTNAELDHTLGLLLLRGAAHLCLHASAAIRQTLVEHLSLERILGSFGPVQWIEAPSAFTPLLCVEGSPSGLEYRALPLEGCPPRFAREAGGEKLGHVLAYQIREVATGVTALFVPEAVELSAPLREWLGSSEAIFFDGTFWSSEELREIDPAAPLAEEMGHLPVSQSLKALSRLPARTKVYVHLNNTNPLLDPASAARAAVEAAGITVGDDGMEFTL